MLFNGKRFMDDRQLRGINKNMRVLFILSILESNLFTNTSYILTDQKRKHLCMVIRF